MPLTTTQTTTKAAYDVHNHTYRGITAVASPASNTARIA